MRRITIPLMTALLAATACERTTRLDTRTFPVEHLTPDEVGALIEPYVFFDREGAPGTYSPSGVAVTVRETADNLDKIQRVLDEYDRPSRELRLYFQLIEADGFQSTDDAIAEVVTELRRIFQFRGYRLAGEAFVSITDGSEVSQRLQASEVEYEIAGTAEILRQGTLRLQDIALYSERGGQLLRTTVNVRAGQTLVLGSSPKPDSDVTLLLTVRAEEVPPTGQ